MTTYMEFNTSTMLEDTSTIFNNVTTLKAPPEQAQKDKNKNVDVGGLDTLIIIAIAYLSFLGIKNRLNAREKRD